MIYYQKGNKNIQINRYPSYESINCIKKCCEGILELVFDTFILQRSFWQGILGSNSYLGKKDILVQCEVLSSICGSKDVGLNPGRALMIF